ncbi:hypothetical protein BS50DRAFT_177734 [Corynespora cassiicola Philippines]|uniref:Uncharacterized protein n=1 Tax=Corynespora cassiicola Philippines TaxID=1448308 RepID=A0A2T2P5U8_CORCC|nr:hypothetical protein BS50DRAFT_177734 [Corynespora cassiicola Philippines]
MRRSGGSLSLLPLLHPRSLTHKPTFAAFCLFFLVWPSIRTHHGYSPDHRVQASLDPTLYRQFALIINCNAMMFYLPISKVQNLGPKSPVFVSTPHAQPSGS